MNVAIKKNFSRYSIVFNIFSILMFLWLSSDSAFAATEIKKIDITSSEYITKYILFLIVVLLFCFLCLWLIKKLKFARSCNQDLIKVIAYYHITPKEKLFIVSVGGEYLLMSSANGNVQFLHKVENLIVDQNDGDAKGGVPESFIVSLKRYMLMHKENT